MKFDELNTKMRVFETAHDHCVLPGLFMVARLDGRGFTRLTKETHKFETPFDERFRDMMVLTTAHLMDCGFRVKYGYTESDEISLLFHKEESLFGRKIRKFNSILAAEASVKFSSLLGDAGIFDCRISQLPSETEVVDYFRWRNEDAHRNALNAHCYWALRKEGQSAKDSTAHLLHLSVADKNELLFKREVNFNDVPNWQKRGVGIYWENFEKEATNPKTKEKVKAVRRRLKRLFDLPMREEYSDFIVRVLKHSE